MKKIKGDFRYYFHTYVNQGLLNAKVLLILLGVYLFFYSGCHGISEKLSKFGMKMNPMELLSSVFGARTVYFILFSLFVLWLHCFDYREDCQYELIRLGKKKWLFRQYLFAFLTSILFYIWAVICFITMFGRQITFQNQWSEMMKTAGSTGRFSVLGISFYGILDKNAVRGVVSPLELAGIHSVLMILCFSCLGMLMITLNLLFRKNVGTLVVLAVVMLTSTVNFYVPGGFLSQCFDFINPIRIAIPKDKIVMTGMGQSLLYGVLYFCLLMYLIWIAGKRVVQNKGGQMQ